MRKNSREEGESSPCKAVIWRQDGTPVYPLDLLRLKLRKVVSEALALTCLREKIKRTGEKQPRVLVISALAWSRLEQSYGKRQGKDWWKAWVPPFASSATLIWCLSRPNCSIALLKRSKAKWTILSVGDTADLGPIRSLFLSLLRDLTSGPLPKIGEVTVHSPDFHPSLTGLVVASDLIQQVQTTGKIKVVSSLSSYPFSMVYDEILALICRSTGMTANALAEVLRKCEAEMALRYLESADGLIGGSKVSSPGTDASTLEAGLERNSTDLPNEPTSPLPHPLSPPPLPDSDSEPSAPFALLSITSPQAASSGPCSSWTFLPPSDRHEDCEAAERRNTTEGSEEREELVYLEYSEEEQEAMSPICEEKEDMACAEEPTTKFQLLPVTIDFQTTFPPALPSADPLESPRVVSPLRLSFPESPGSRSSPVSSSWRQYEVDTNDTGKFHKTCPRPSAEGCFLL